MRFTSDRFDPNRDVMQLLDLPDGHGAIRAIQDAFNQTALGVPGAIGKLWHWRETTSKPEMGKSNLRFHPRMEIFFLNRIKV